MHHRPRGLLHSSQVEQILPNVLVWGPDMAACATFVAKAGDNSLLSVCHSDKVHLLPLLQHMIIRGKLPLLQIQSCEL
jgi:hypothetical protein